MRRQVWILMFAPAVVAPAASGETIAELRRELAEAGAEARTPDFLGRLGDQALALAEGAGERGKFWNAMGFVADVCELSPPATSKPLRADALAILAERFTDTRRWSTLVTMRFAPPLQTISLEQWRRELDDYDRALDLISKSAANERVQAELLFAKIHVRAMINRSADWLTKDDRSKALGMISQLERNYGSLPAPGNRNDAADTVGARAARIRYELERLYFGAPAPPTVGTDINGQPIDVADNKGNIVLLDFWTSFCTPCLEMVPDVKHLLSDHAGKPVVYIGVNGDSDSSRARGTAKRLSMTWRNIWDGHDSGPNGPIAEAWSVTGWPALFVIDADGRIRFKFYSKEEIDEGLRDAVDDLLKEREP